MIKAFGYAAKHSFSRLKLFPFKRPSAGPGDATPTSIIRGTSGGNTVYPCMPGHEMTGRVRAVGLGVTRNAVGDIVGIGCMVDSCGRCEPCREGDENYCECPNGMLQTYNGPVIPAAMAAGSQNIYGRDNTFGGYSDVMVVHERTAPSGDHDRMLVQSWSGC